MLPGFFWDTFKNACGKVKEKAVLTLIASALPPDTKTPAVRGGPGPLPGCGETEGEPPAFFPRNGPAISAYGMIKEKYELALIAGALLPDKKTPAVRESPTAGVVPLTGVEPVRNFFREILSLLCLPIPP